MATTRVPVYSTGPAKGHDHTHTVILLHGRDSDYREFAADLFESEASEPADQPRTLPDLFPSVRWVFPEAPMLRSLRFHCDMSQWFDMWSTEDPDDRPELQTPGLEESIRRIHHVLGQEASIVPLRRIYLGGISQGFAAAVAAFLSSSYDMAMAGLVGFSSWMPSIPRNPDIAASQQQQTGPRQTPVFLAHSVDDGVVPIRNGQVLRDLLGSRFQLAVEWHEYDLGGHWVNEPQGVDDLVFFLRATMNMNAGD